MRPERFKESSFNSVDYVELLSRKLVYEVSLLEEEYQVTGAKGENMTLFNTSFLDLFEKELKDLENQRKKTKKHIIKLADECKSSMERYKDVLGEANNSFEIALEQFQSLDARILDIGNIAITIGESLQEVDHQRGRAKEAAELIHYFLELNTGEEPESEIFYEPDLLRERAKLLKNLNDLTRELKLERTEIGKTMVEVQSSELENHLLRVFTQASDNTDYIMMKECAETLYEFNGGDNCVRKYINLIGIFFDTESIDIEEKRAYAYLNLLREDEILRKNEDTPLQQFFDNLLIVCKREQGIISRVFPNTSSVMNRLVRRMFDQNIRMFIETLLRLTSYSSENLLVYLKALYQAHKATEGLVDELKQIGDVGDVNFDEHLDSLFLSYKEDYLSKEISCLEQLYKQEIAGKTSQATPTSSFFGRRTTTNNEEDFNTMMLARVCITLVHMNRNAVHRCLVLSDDHTLPHSLYKIFMTLLEFLGRQFIIPILDKALLQLSKIRPSRELSVQSEFLQWTQQVNQVRITLETHFHREMLPHIAHAINVHNQFVLEKSTVMSQFEEKINRGLVQVLSLIIENVRRGLASMQKRNDFRLAEDAFEEIDKPTNACVVVVRFIQDQVKEVRRNLDGTNVEVFLEEMGLGLFTALLDHFKKFTISQGMGGLKLKRDLQEYFNCVKDTLTIERVTTRFQILPELANIHLLAPSQLRGLLEDSVLSKMPRDQLIEFLKLRSDWKASWVLEYRLQK